MLTQRGVALLIGAVVLWIVGRTLGLPELYVVAAATGALVAVSALAVSLSTTTIAARRHVSPTRIPHGDTGGVALELRNERRLPASLLPSLLLVEDACHPLLREDPDNLRREEPDNPWATAGDGPRFVVPDLRAGRSVTLRYPLSGSLRGRYTVGPLRVAVRDPFGVVQRTRRYTATDDVLVHPHVERLHGRVALGAHRGSGASSARRVLNTGDEFHTMREYVTGDDLRQVHWPTTAHRQKLMVRQNELPWDAEATVLCDARAAAHRGHGPDSTLERSVSAAASVLCHLADAGYRLRLLTEADDRPQDFDSPLAWLDRLAELEASDEPTLGRTLHALRRASSGGLLAAVLAAPPGDQPVTEHADVRALLQAGRGFTGRLAVVVDTDAPAGRDAAGGASRAEQLAALLVAAGWRAAPLRDGHTVADAWTALMSSRRPRAPAGAGGRR